MFKDENSSFFFSEIPPKNEFHHVGLTFTAQLLEPRWKLPNCLPVKKHKFRDNNKQFPDPENVGFCQWRVAFYCADHVNFLRLLDGWFQHKEKQIAREQPVEVVIHPHTGIDLSSLLEDDLSYENYTINEPANSLPLHIFDAQPVTGKKITVLNLQVRDEATLDLLVTGHTWPFKASGGIMEVLACTRAELYVCNVVIACTVCFCKLRHPL